MKITGVKPIICQGGIRNWTFVKVTTDEGIIGWGDATEWARVQSHRQTINDLSRVVIGEDPFNIERIWQKMWRASYVGGKDFNVAMTGIETALWDIMGKALGVPVYTLLGGRCRNRIRLYYGNCDAYGSGYQGTTQWKTGDSSLEGIAKQAAMIKNQKFSAIKCHPVGLSEASVSRIATSKAIADTTKKIATIRTTVGNDIDIIIDITNRLDLPSSIAMARALEAFHLLFMEDPIRQDESPASYRRLVNATSTPIASGENLYTVWSFRNFLEIGGLDVLRPDVCHAGILQTKKIAALGEAYHVPLAPHNPNSPLSTIISGHLCTTIPNLLILEYYGDEREPPWRDEVTSPPLRSFINDGYLDLPTRPGWGIEMNEDEIEKHPYVEVWYTRFSRLPWESS